jgi:hypothetical protein
VHRSLDAPDSLLDAQERIDAQERLHRHRESQRASRGDILSAMSFVWSRTCASRPYQSATASRCAQLESQSQCTITLRLGAQPHLDAQLRLVLNKSTHVVSRTLNCAIGEVHFFELVIGTRASRFMRPDKFDARIHRDARISSYAIACIGMRASRSMRPHTSGCGNLSGCVISR